MTEQSALKQEGRGQRVEFTLPIDIEQSGESVKAGTSVRLFPDQIERIKNAAAEAKLAEKKGG